MGSSGCAVARRCEHRRCRYHRRGRDVGTIDRHCVCHRGDCSLGSCADHSLSNCLGVGRRVEQDECLNRSKCNKGYDCQD